MTKDSEQPKHATWVRGLKQEQDNYYGEQERRTPRGCVD